VVPTAVATNSAVLCDVTPCGSVEITSVPGEQASATVTPGTQAKQAAGDKPSASCFLLPPSSFLPPSCLFSPELTLPSVKSETADYSQNTSPRVTSGYSTRKKLAYLWGRETASAVWWSRVPGCRSRGLGFDSCRHKIF
jgi:hypothetical protein